MREKLIEDRHNLSGKMKKMKPRNKHVVLAIILSFLIFSLPITRAIAVGDLLRQPRVYKFNFDTKIEIGREEYFLERNLVVTEWYHNNTRKIFATGRLHSYGIRVNITKFTKIVKEKTTVKPRTVFPGKYYWDGLLFLPEGNNGTHWVKYDHDDNYDTYHPQEWYTHWNLTGNSKNHVHLSYQEVQDWKADTSRTADVLAGILGGAAAGTELLIAVAMYLGCTVPLVLPILAAVAGLLAVIVWAKGYLMVTWIEDVVEAAHGDGWCWCWSLERYYWYSLWTYFHCPWLLRVHETQWWMSWGAERDEPELIEVQWSIGIWHLPMGGRECRRL
ncbi:hypothetical protein CW667_02875 [Candidatus Bathyarchaeota archaeon]|nr:MAG: hypothetical protein CW667_02875 [Candidatus Bathyarchaeota archaeon]